MNEIVPVEITDTTVTLSRQDWDAIVERLEDAEDREAVDDHLAVPEADRVSYTDAEVGRMLDGVSPITIWRERAGLSGRALAAAAGVNSSYLHEIEAGKKPGSVEAMRAIATALGVAMERLLD